MYDRTYWVDHVQTPDNTYDMTNVSTGEVTQVTLAKNGEIIQQGTLQDQSHFNKIELGINDAGLGYAISQFKQMQEDYDYQSEVQTVTLGMNSYSWPFNNKETTVALKQLRETTNYSVDISVESYSGGLLGNIKVLDKAQNGFKLLHDGSATSVTLTVKVEGGMTE